MNRERWRGTDKSTSPSRHRLCRRQAALHGVSGATRPQRECPQRHRATNHCLIQCRVRRHRTFRSCRGLTAMVSCSGFGQLVFLPVWPGLGTKDSVRSKSGFAHTNEYPVSVQSGRANDTATVPVSRQKGPRLRHRGETSSLSTAQAETPRPRDRPGEYTPHVRLYPARAYPIQNVATALQSAHSGRRRSLRVFLGLARVPVHK